MRLMRAVNIAVDVSMISTLEAAAIIPLVG